MGDSTEVYIAGIGICDLFCACDLDLDPVTFIYELDPCYIGYANMTSFVVRTSRPS